MLKTTRKTYGTTWWGQAWLQLLEEAADASRLSRGKTYANNGSVSRMTIQHGVVNAQVNGSYGNTYRVTVSLASYSGLQQNALTGIISNQPTFALELSMNQLPTGLAEALAALRMPLIPQDWSELEGSCTCPDHEYPCKHLSAVLLLMAHEIDKDPLILLRLRGVSNPSTLLPSGYGDCVESAETLQHPYNNVFVSVKDRLAQSNPLTPERLPDQWMEAMSFQYPPCNVDGLLALLTDNPAFYTQGNFRTFIYNLYGAVAQGLPGVLPPVAADHRLGTHRFQLSATTQTGRKGWQITGKIMPDENTPDSLLNHTANITEALAQRRLPVNPATPALSRPAPVKVITETGSVWQSTGTAKKPAARLQPVVAYAPEALADFLNFFLAAPLPQPQEELSESYRFLSMAASVASGLVQANRYIPELWMDDSGSFSIRYAPLTGLEDCPALTRTLESLQALMPPDLWVNPNQQCLPASPAGLREVLSLLMTHLIHQALKTQRPPDNHPLFPLFLSGGPYQGKGFSDTSTARSVAAWLEALHLRRQTIAPALRIELSSGKSGDTFQLHVDVMDRTDPLAPMLPYAHLFGHASQPAQPVARKRGRPPKAKPTDSATLPAAPGPSSMIFGQPADQVASGVSRQLMMAARYFPLLKDVVNAQGQLAPSLPLPVMSALLLNTASMLELLGIPLILPKKLKKLVTPGLQISGQMKGSAGEGKTSYLNLTDVLEFSYDIALGDERISPQEFKQLVKKTEGLIQYKDQYLLLKPNDVSRLLQQLNKPLTPPRSMMEALFIAVTGEYEGLHFQADEALKRLVASVGESVEVPLPSGLQATLRPYQLRGFQWLATNIDKGFGCCIADDMGLGKTIQVIALLLHLKETPLVEAPSVAPAKKSGGKVVSVPSAPAIAPAPSLVICPTTLIGNWQKECQRFAPSLNVLVYHGTERTLHLKGVDVVLTSYGTFRRDISKLKTRSWRCLILDEAQNIKNSETAQTRSIKSLKAEHYIAMTGTPVENRLSELWNIFDFTNPGYLGSQAHFRKTLGTPIEKYRDPEAIDRLKKATQPFILRRLKTDKAIISDLPDKLIIDEYCQLTREQAALYQNVVDDIMRKINGSGGMERRGLIFKLMTALKQVCNHPAHFANQGAVQAHLSGKADKTLKLLESALDLGEKTLIFTQYTEMGRLLQEMIQSELKEETLFFHGSLTRGNRDELVHQLQNDRRRKIMILSLKAGGTGLNLTAASQVIHYDLWWNPAVENQATDRAFRIGQQKNVSVHRLITMGTFEEKIDEMIRAKRDLADLTVASAERTITELSNAELHDIFKLTV